MCQRGGGGQLDRHRRRVRGAPRVPATVRERHLVSACPAVGGEGLHGCNRSVPGASRWCARKCSALVGPKRHLVDLAQPDHAVGRGQRATFPARASASLPPADGVIALLGGRRDGAHPLPPPGSCWPAVVAHLGDLPARRGRFCSVPGTDPLDCQALRVKPSAAARRRVGCWWCPWPSTLVRCAMSWLSLG